MISHTYKINKLYICKYEMISCTCTRLHGKSYLRYNDVVRSINKTYV